MTSIGTHGLSCLDENDYGAVALSMQANAGAIDSTLAADLSALNGYRNRPWLWCANSAALTVDSASGQILPPDLGIGTEVFPTAGGGFPPINNGMPDTSTAAFFPQGLYLAGSSINYTVATPNNGTLRTLEVYGVRTINGTTNPATTYTQLTQNIVRETSIGGTASLSVTGFVYTPGGSDLRFLRAAFLHTNTSSVLAVPAGGWQFWYIFLGSGVTI